jgi:hypothetical protein
MVIATFSENRGRPGRQPSAGPVYWCRSQTPKSRPPFDSTDGLITTAPDVLALMVSTISLAAQGPGWCPCRRCRW